MGVESTNPVKSFASLFKSTVGTGSGPESQAPIEFTIQRYNISNILQSTTDYPNASPDTTYVFSVEGYYLLTIPSSSSPITFDMWVWGAGGEPGGGPGPGLGGAGGGVKGRYTFNSPNTITFIVGSTGSSGVGGWSDGGTSPPGYIEGGGGGSSRIAEGTIPFPTINSAPNVYLLIGGGGGGGSSYVDYGGTYGGSAGYPSGNPGGAYYPADGAAFGQGGTQSSGGAGGSSGREGAGTPGGKYYGGPGNGGAGGGGYFGGGGAGGYYAMGGGGSSYIHPSLSFFSVTSSFSATPGPSHFAGVDSSPPILPLSAADSGGTGFIRIQII